MRPGLVVRFALAAALSAVAFVGGCSSDEPASGTTDSGPNKCEASGGKCNDNYPFACGAGQEAVATGEAATACGFNESAGKQVPCCVLSVPKDTGIDTATDVGTDATDGAADAPAEAGDATPPGETGDAADAADGG